MSKMISAEEWDRIKQDYAHVDLKNDHELDDECKAHDDWQKVYKAGCDSKYGSIMVSHEMQAWRSQTMDEFYGCGPWD